MPKRAFLGNVTDWSISYQRSSPLFFVLVHAASYQSSLFCLLPLPMIMRIVFLGDFANGTSHVSACTFGMHEFCNQDGHHGMSFIRMAGQLPSSEQDRQHRPFTLPHYFQSKLLYHTLHIIHLALSPDISHLDVKEHIARIDRGSVVAPSVPSSTWHSSSLPGIST